MRRRFMRIEGILLLIAVVVLLPIYLIAKVVEMTGWILPAVVVVLAVAVVIWVKHARKQKRLAYLRSKYQDEEIVQQVFEGYFWQGQTKEQLLDSLGPPAGKDHKLLKTIDREVWKYQQSGRNRYKLRITVEDGCVVGWGQKD